MVSLRHENHALKQRRSPCHSPSPCRADARSHALSLLLASDGVRMGEHALVAWVYLMASKGHVFALLTFLSSMSRCHSCAISAQHALRRGIGC
jgi:hypothetical protein